jgi:hypothetical protein
VIVTKGATNPGGSGKAPMTDDEYVAAYEKDLQAVRARLAEFHADCKRRAGELGPISDEVQATFDVDGYLENLYIEPTALTRHTYIELEDLITDVLRASNERMRDAMREVIGLHIGPDAPVHEYLQ